MQQSVPIYHELMWPTVKALRELGGSGQNAEISVVADFFEQF